jgi:hypothetical protein
MHTYQLSRALYCGFALAGFLMLCGGIGCFIELRRSGSIVVPRPNNKGYYSVPVAPGFVIVAVNISCGLGVLGLSVYQLAKPRRP